MNVNEVLEKFTKQFDLECDNTEYVYLACAKREIIIRNFLAGCPDPLYAKYGNRNAKERAEALVRFLISEDFVLELKKPHGCVIHRSELRKEMRIIPRIRDKELREETRRLYQKIQNRMGVRKSLALVCYERTMRRVNQEVALHEGIHVLMEENGLRPRSWKWNEGLVTYLTHFVLGTHKRLERVPAQTIGRLAKIYARYALKWALKLKNVENPSERKRLIRKHISRVDRMK